MLSTKCSSETLQNLLYFMHKKTHVVFFVFHFMQLYILSYDLMSTLNIDQGIHKVKIYSCTKWKTKKTTWVFLCIKYSKIWSILLEHFVERKPLISEECIGIFFNLFILKGKWRDFCYLLIASCHTIQTHYFRFRQNIQVCIFCQKKGGNELGM